MAFDEKLADRIRSLIADKSIITEKKMFGGLAFLVNGNMSITASGKGGILVRVDPEQYKSLGKESGVEVAVMRGKPMHGWLRLSADQVQTKKQLERWVRICLSYAEQLPQKKAK